MSQLDKIKVEVESSLKEFPCFYIEDKKVSFAVHYRNCPKVNLGNLEKVKSTIEKYRKVMPVNAIEGKKVIEVKSSNINKGKAINALRQNSGLNDSISICMGDDVTDEYMFRENEGGLNIKVGRGIESKANYYLVNVGEVQKFLNLFI